LLTINLSVNVDMTTLQSSLQSKPWHTERAQWINDAMAGFSTISELALAEADLGQSSYYTWRKTPTQATTIGIWFDLSMSPGNPNPQYYADSPLAAVAMARSTDGGIQHGASVSPQTKYLRQIMAMTTTATPLPMPMILMDYLLYYPFIDEGVTDPQIMTNSVTLPRYTTGAGVQMMAVSVAGRTGGQSFYVTYTNSDGVADRVSQTVIQNSVSLNGSIVTSDRAAAGAAGPFIPLQEGDTGVRSIQSVTMLGGDVGLFTIVLVKPLAQLQIRGIDAPVEVDYFRDFSQCPVIKDDAYLNFICCPAGSLSAVPIHGDIKVVWA
jgi:hypothetical protein